MIFPTLSFFQIAQEVLIAADMDIAMMMGHVPVMRDMLVRSVRAVILAT